jgi:uncharacterized membrane protein HdeD (DUF308 family)
MSQLLAQNWWALALRGVFAIIFALIAFFSPGATLLSLVWVFAAYMLVDGVFGIVSGIRAASNNQRWGLLILEGILNILVGVIAFLMPGLTVLFFVTLMAVWSLITGVLMIVAAFKLNPTYGRGWLIFSGIVSVLFGIALLLAPLVGLQAEGPQGRNRHRGTPGGVIKEKGASSALCLFRSVAGQLLCRLSLRSGDQVGSDAKDGVGTGCSTRPVMSTM